MLSRGMLRTDRIAQAAYQPRQVFEPEALAELAQSIREKGVLQPLLVRPAGDPAREIGAQVCYIPLSR